MSRHRAIEFIDSAWQIFIFCLLLVVLTIALFADSHTTESYELSDVFVDVVPVCFVMNNCRIVYYREKQYIVSNGHATASAITINTSVLNKAGDTVIAFSSPNTVYIKFN